MNASPKVAIVILNWNGRKYLEQFLPSVMATDWTNLEVFVADNGSTDDSVNFVQQHYPSVHIISLPQNYGFAKGYNGKAYVKNNYDEKLRQAYAKYA